MIILAHISSSQGKSRTDNGERTRPERVIYDLSAGIDWKLFHKGALLIPNRSIGRHCLYPKADTHTRVGAGVAEQDPMSGRTFHGGRELLAAGSSDEIVAWAILPDARLVCVMAPAGVCARHIWLHSRCSLWTKALDGIGFDTMLIIC